MTQEKMIRKHHATPIKQNWWQKASIQMLMSIRKPKTVILEIYNEGVVDSWEFTLNLLALNNEDCFANRLSHVCNHLQTDQLMLQFSSEKKNQT